MGKITRDEISESDLFKEIRQSALDTIEVIEKLNAELRKSGESVKKDVAGADLKSAKGIDKFSKATEKANKLQKDSEKLKTAETKATETLNTANKKLEKTKAQEMKTERELLKETRLLNAEKERGAKVTEKQAKAIKDENSAYKQLVKSTRDQKNASKDLAAEMLHLQQNGGKNTKEFRQLEREYNKVTRAAQKGDKALKKIDGTVGDNFRNVGNYRSALGGLTRVLSGLGLAFGGLSIIKSAGQTIVEFDKNIQDLRAITGASGSDLEFFKEQAKTLGTEVEGGASAVIEAYKLIGSAKPELLKNAEALNAVTEAAITLSQASGLDLPDAATRLTDAMNQFGAPAEEAGKFINVLANGALFGSAAIPDVTDALLKFGAAANTSNVSLEESTALIEALASKGLKGAEAGTALRNVMLKLSAPDALPKEAQKAMADLGISLEDLSDTSKPFADRLDLLKPLLTDNAALVRTFGTENAIAATNLLNMTDDIRQLTVDMKTQGTVQEQAAKNTDTVAHAFNKLKETFNKVILDMDAGAGIGEKLKSVLGFLADNLGTIVSVLGTAIKLFVAYKVATLASAAANKLATGSISGLIKSQGLLKGSLNGLKGAFTKLGNFLKTNIFGAVLLVVVELVREFSALNAITAKIKENQQNLKDATKDVATNLKLEKTEAAGLFGALKETNFESANRVALIDQINSQYGLTLKNLKDEKEFTAQLAVAQEAVNKQLEEKARIAGAQIRFELSQKQLAEAEMANKRAFEALTAFQDAGIGEKAFGTLFEKLGGVGESELLGLKQAAQEVLDSARKDAAQYEKQYLDLQKTLAKIPAIPPTGGAPGGTTPNGDPKPDAEKRISLLRQIEDEQIKQIQDDEKRQIAKLKSDAKRRIEDLNGQIVDGKEKADLILEINESLMLDIADAEKTAGDKQNAATLAFLAERRKIKTEAADKEAEDEAKRAQEAKDAQEAELAQLDQMFTDSEKKHYLELLKSNKKQEQIDAEMLQFQIDQLKKRIEVYQSMRIDTTDEEIKLQELIRQQNAKGNKAIEDDDKEHFERVKQLSDAITDYYKKNADERIAKIDEEIKKAQEQSAIFEKLAAEGNIKATESLAEQNKIIAEANRAKEKEEQRKRRADLINAAVQIYTTKASDPTIKHPLFETIRDITLLTQFLANIPTFLDGTEDTGANGQGIDGKGGFNAILHPNERVLTKEQNQQIGGLSNNELAKVAAEYNTGKLINGNGANQIGNAWETSAIIKQLSILDETIKNKPETNIRLEEIINGALLITRETKQGNSIVYNRYKTKA